MVRVREVRDWLKTGPAYIGDIYEKYYDSFKWKQCNSYGRKIL